MTSESSGPSGPSSRRGVIIGLWIVGILAVLAFTLSSFGGGNFVADEPTTTEESDQGEIHGVEMGTVAPDVRFQVDGSNVSLDSFRGERILLWFPVSDCETCQTQARMMAENASRLQHLTIIAVTPRQTSDVPAGADFAAEYAPDTLSESNWHWGVPSEAMMETYNPERSHGLGYLINESHVVVARGSKPADNIGVIADFGNGTVE